LAVHKKRRAAHGHHQGEGGDRAPAPRPCRDGRRDQCPLGLDPLVEPHQGQQFRGPAPAAAQRLQTMEFLKQLGRILETFRRVLGQEADDDRFQRERDRGVDLAGRLHLVVDLHPHDFRGIVAVERRPAAEHVIQRRAEGVEVGARVEGGLAAALLRRAILRRAFGKTFLFRRHARPPRQTEVGHLGLAVLGQQDVGGFDVAVHDARPPPGVIERLRHLRGNLERLGFGQLGVAHEPVVQ
jgi:hypothetical protein